MSPIERILHRGGSFTTVQPQFVLILVKHQTVIPLNPLKTIRINFYLPQHPPRVSQQLSPLYSDESMMLVDLFPKTTLQIYPNDCATTVYSFIYGE